MMSVSFAQIDSELVHRIHLAVDHHPHIKPGRVSFEASQGHVFIRGQVASYFEKQMAQEALRSVEGIQAIENEIEVCW